MGNQLYGYTRDEHEYQVSIPQLSTDDGALAICISAHGGGTVGQVYAGNGWDYAVFAGDCVVIEGSDIRSAEGRPAGHAEMARTLAVFLSTYGEHFSYGHARYCQASCEYDEYSQTEREWLAANYERLGMFADEGSDCSHLGLDDCETCQHGNSHV